MLDFLAIDRFTGGGRDSAKFDALALWKPQFSVRLFLDNPEPWELGWLALTLRDLQDGLATVGFGRAKGFGQCTVEDRKLTIGILHSNDFPLPQLKSDKADATVQAASAAGKRFRDASGTTSGLYKTIADDAAAAADWLALANGWVKVFNELVRDPDHGFKHSFGLNDDSYFTQKSGHWLPDLYPARVSR